MFPVAEKPKVVDPSRSNSKKNVDSSTKPQAKRMASTKSLSGKKEVAQRSKLPDKMNHPQNTDQSRSRSRQAQKTEEPKRLGRDRTRTRTLSPTEVKMARGEPQDKPKSRTENRKETSSVMAVAGPSTSQQHEQSAGEVLQQQQQDNEDYDDYEDDFEV